ncbi:MAG: hypothetical protein ABI673_06930 [Novosphingobium sp.]
MDRHPRAEGHFSNVSDYVRDLIRRDQDAVAELRWLQGEINKGLASPVDPRSLDKIFSDIMDAGRASIKETT